MALVRDPSGRGRVLVSVRLDEPIRGVVGVVAEIRSGYRQGEWIAYVDYAGEVGTFTESRAIGKLLAAHDEWIRGMRSAAPHFEAAGLTPKHAKRWAVERMGAREIRSIPA